MKGLHRMTTQTMTWRTFLDDHCRRLKATEKQAFANQVGVSQTTINRWRRGKDNPSRANLERMLAAFSESQRQQLLVLLRRDAHTCSLLPADIHLPTWEHERYEPIPLLQVEQLDHFCLKVLRLQRDTSDRFWQVAGAVLYEALTHLETYPEQVGLELTVATCMPPRNGAVRSLRLLVGMGTAPWRQDLHRTYGFVGATDLMGNAVANQHGEMIPDFTETSLALSASPLGQERSAAAFPLQREHAVAGALMAVSRQPQYFTPERMALLEIFADILRLAFYDQDFYPLSHINLGLMPSQPVQRKMFASFRQRVEREYQAMIRSDTHSMRDLMQVEDRVLLHMEEELLRGEKRAETPLMHQ